MKVIFFVTEDWYFCSHRLTLARTFREKGYQVVVATKANGSEPKILAEGLRFIDLDYFRQYGGLLRGLRTFGQIFSICRKEQPDLIHNIALKPVLLGTVAGRLARVPLIVNTVAGLGHLFISNQSRYRIARSVLLQIMKRVFQTKKVRIVVQNQDDLAFFTQHKLASPGQMTLIPGAGVDVEHFCPADKVPTGVPVVLCHSRMLWSKGIREFVAAAKILHKEGCPVRMVLAGAPDSANPESIPLTTLEGLQSDGAVEYWGFRRDIDQVLKVSSIVVLPSYREGLPKSLLEAAAAGLPIIAFDVPGCREIVHHEQNGLLVPLGDIPGLAAAIRRLVDSPKDRQLMGQNGRAMVLKYFSQEIINEMTVQVGTRTGDAGKALL